VLKNVKLLFLNYKRINLPIEKSPYCPEILRVVKEMPANNSL
jgi:hypothetical protein